ncbi:unnamed protein product, partial [Rotaria sordida]
SQMSNLILDTLTIYGLENIPMIINVNNKKFYPKIRPNTQIVDVNGLGLSMSQNYMLTWTTTETPIVKPPQALLTEPKYRVDCHPDSDVTSNTCLARGCIWDIPMVSGFPSCYIPKEK